MKNVILFFGCLLLAACAYSPQQVSIAPYVDMNSEEYGNGRAVKVVVQDNREKKALGSRGGVYKETSLITISNDIEKAVTKVAEAKLATQGFNINSRDVENANLTIVIEELSYDSPDQSLGKKVNLNAVLKLEAVAGGERYTGRYRSNSELQTVITPTMSSNEKMINEILSETLVRLFSDPKLKVFLSNI